MLSYIYLHLHEYDLAEKSIRETLSGVYGDTDTTLAAILMHKGNITEAEKMYQRCLFKSVNECINALTGLSGTAGKLENEEHFLCYEKMILTICDLFYETNLFGTKINPYLSLCHYYGAKDMEEEFIYYLERLVESINTWSEKNDLSSNTFFFHLKSCDNTIFSSLMGDGVNEIADAVEKFQGFEKQEYITELLHQLRNRSI